MNNIQKISEKKKPTLWERLKDAWLIKKRTWRGRGRRAWRWITKWSTKCLKFLEQCLKWLENKFDTLPGLLVFIFLVYMFGRYVYFRVGYEFTEIFAETSSDETRIIQEKPSELLRNHFWIFWMIMTATFATVGLWFTNRARLNREKGLGIERQRLNSERFQKAVEMIANKEQLMMKLGGLYILRDLAQEDPEHEHIRCIDIIADWLRENHSASQKDKEKNDRDYFFSLDIIDQKTWSKEQKERARQYRKVWHWWPQLQNVRFSKAFCFNFNLYRTSLVGADLTEANLARADLTGANLARADLTGANLYQANLTRADLTGADLTGADLTGADLTKASLHEADLTGADLTSAKGLTREQLEDAIWDEEDPPKNSPIPLPE